MCSNAQELEESIQETLRSGDGEVEYWEAVLQLLAVSKARARISEISTDLVAKARALQHDREGAAQQRQVAEAMGWDKVRCMQTWLRWDFASNKRCLYFVG
jgi:hypothetical protein